MDEATLIGRAKAGDRSAFRALLEEHAPRVMAVCHRLLLDAADAEDLSQEVFVEAFLSIGSFRGDAKLSTWLHRIAVTKCLDELKKRKRKKRLAIVGRLLRFEEVEPFLAGGARPDAELEADERRRAIAAALDALPDNQRVAFSLSKIEGYSNDEIANVLGTTVTAVESLIYRAKKQLRGTLHHFFSREA